MSCFFCGCNNNLITCLVCNQLFCNNRKSSISHVVFHLVRSKHRQIKTDSIICCEFCPEQNIFRLGFKNDEISCHSCYVKNGGCVREWEPAIVERCLDQRIAESDKTRFDIKELTRIIEKPYGLKKSTTFFKGDVYEQTFVRLLKVECEEERKMKETQTLENIRVSFSKDVKDKKETYMAQFINKADIDLRITIGDEVEIIKEDTSVVGYVQKTGELVVVKTSDSKVLKFCDTKSSDFTMENATIKFIWKGVGYKRMIEAVEKIYKVQAIYEAILTGKIAQKKNKNKKKVKECRDLNESQRIAVSAALSGVLTLIQGPPGTGKTITSAQIVKGLVEKGYKVMVVAPSNTAVDQITLGIYKLGLKVMRVHGKNRELVNIEDASGIYKLSLDYQYKKLIDKYEDYEETHESRTKICRALLDVVDVVTCTCVTAGSSIFKKRKYEAVLIDEACQATEPQCLIPLLHGCKKLILVGDHQQLGPTILNKEAAAAGLKTSLFERMVSMGVVPHLLNTQYRMHPQLAEYPNIKYYGSKIVSGVSALMRSSFMPPSIFYCVYGKEELSISGTSFLNRSEAIEIKLIIRHLINNGIKNKQIGVITFYEGQRSLLVNMLNANNSEGSSIFQHDEDEIEIMNVDGFQGREKDYIILSLVRSNINQGIGFLKNERRINVALTRAKHGLFIAGNPNTLLKDPVWCDLLSFYDAKGWVFDGPINSLKRVPLKKHAFDFRELIDAFNSIE